MTDPAVPPASSAPVCRTLPTPALPGPAVFSGLLLAGLLAADAARAQLLAAGSQFWHQGVPGMVDDLEPSEVFGVALAAGDFDGDGHADLAIGVPGETVGGAGIPGGAVHVLYSAGSTGLGTPGNALLHQALPGSADPAEDGDNLGWALAAGDFDGDGFDDLAAAVPVEDIEPGEFDEGAVHVFYGSVSGLGMAGNQLWSQSTPGVSGDSEASDLFGYGLAAGDFDGDGFGDLAVGVRETFEGALLTATSGGRVVVLFGTAAGLSAAGQQDWHQDSPGIAEIVDSFDLFGARLAAGDFDGNGFDDLAVGVPGEDDAAGAVAVLYGTAGGLTANGSQHWEQGLADLPGLAEPEDGFGAVLATGDLNGDGFDDLAVGVPQEDVGPEGAEIDNAGAVYTLYGSASGLVAVGSQVWTQDTGGVLGVAEPADRFGTALACPDPNADGFADLAIGVLFDTLDSDQRAGAVHVLYGTEFGVLFFGNELWHQDTPGIADVGEDFDRFGHELVAGDFDGRGTHLDLAIGVPAEAPGGGPLAGAGAVHVLYGYLFADGFEGGDLDAWSVLVP